MKNSFKDNLDVLEMLGNEVNRRQWSLRQGLPGAKQNGPQRRVRDEDHQHLRQKKSNPADQRRQKLFPVQQQVPVHFEILRRLFRKGLRELDLRVHGPRHSFGSSRDRS